MIASKHLKPLNAGGSSYPTTTFFIRRKTIGMRQSRVSFPPITPAKPAQTPGPPRIPCAFSAHFDTYRVVVISSVLQPLSAAQGCICHAANVIVLTDARDGTHHPCRLVSHFLISLIPFDNNGDTSGVFSHLAQYSTTCNLVSMAAKAVGASHITCYCCDVGENPLPLSKNDSAGFRHVPLLMIWC